MTPFGYELVLDLKDCDESMFTEDDVRRFCEELCDLIDMQREDFHLWASNPDEYEDSPPHLYGVSAVQFITTSSIVIHTLNKLQAVYLNIFSCKYFDADEAAAFSARFFGGRIVSRTDVERA